jgi:hypothetical protein
MAAISPSFEVVVVWRLHHLADRGLNRRFPMRNSGGLDVDSKSILIRISVGKRRSLAIYQISLETGEKRRSRSQPRDLRAIELSFPRTVRPRFSRFGHAGVADFSCRWPGGEPRRLTNWSAGDVRRLDAGRT